MLPAAKRFAQIVDFEENMTPRKQRQFGISVVIPVYDRKEMLLRALESIRTSQPERVEILVVDDASPADVRAFLPEKNHCGVTVRGFRLERNSGPQAARNLGIRRARYSYVALLDSDDLFTPDKIDSVFSELRNGTPDIVFHGAERMERYHRSAMRWLHSPLRVIPLRWMLVFYNPIVTPTITFRRNLNLGPAALRHCEDYAFLLNYCNGSNTDIRYIDRLLTICARPTGTRGGQSESYLKMRRGEFQARTLMLRAPGFGDIVRFAIGTGVGCLRVFNDVVRGRYWR